MSQRPVIQRPAWLAAVLSVMVAMLTAIPARPAQALTAGDIVFVTDRWDGYGEIALRKANGDVVNLTDDGADANYSTPVVSPDGSKIAYKSDTSPTGLYVMNADGSGQRRVTNNQQASGYGQWTDLTPSWNASSDELVFARYGNDVGAYHQNQEIYKVSLDGSAPTRLTTNSDYDGDPAWSPDGNSIAFLSSRTGGTGIYTMSTSGGSQTLKKALTCSPGELDWPVTSTVYYSCNDSGTIHVYSLATASNWGGTPDDLIDNGSYTSELSPSGDSDSVVFSSYRDGNNELYEMATNGASQTRKTTNAANDREPDYVTATYPSGTTSKEYVSLGDSVASGEGIADAWYWDSSQNGGNGAWVRGDSSPQWASSIIAGEDCHRTDSAYPSHIAFVKGWNLHPYACSGAESVNGILNKQDAWHTSEADLPQLGSNEPAYDDPNTDYDSVAPDVVTITIGANDIGFAGWIVACFIGAPGTPCGSTEDTNTLHAAMYGSTGFTADLKEVLREIKRRGEAVNPDKVPDVYLTKYYDPFPASYTQCPDTVPDGLVADGITSGEMSWLRTALSDLNEAIQDVADDSEFSGMNPRVVDLASVMDGHRWCSADPWVYGPSILNTDLLNKAVFHPTPAGQAAIRNEFLACINNSSNCD